MFGLKINYEKRYHGLDVARAFAIFLVVFSHSLWISNFYPSTVKWLMQLSGTIGVEIFFVISGFLIGRIVLQLVEKDDFSLQTIFSFLKRRWFRTLPNYYLILLLNLILWYLIYEKIPEKLFLYFFYLQNLTETSPDFYRISWSLAVEQFCYILGPIVLLLFVKIFPNIKRKYLFLGMSLLMIVTLFVLRIYFNSSHAITSITDWNQSVRKVTVYRLDAIYYGFILYYLLNNGVIKSTYNQILFIIGLLGVFVLHVLIFMLGIKAENYPFFFTVLFLPLNSISICLMLPYLINLRIKNGFFLYFATLISLISYSIYLLHYTIILHGLKTIFPSDSLRDFDLLFYTLMYWLLVFVLSVALYKFFEYPITNLRNKEYLKIDKKKAL